MSAFAISHPGTGPYQPGDRVVVVFPQCLVRHGKPLRFEGTVLGAFNADFRMWRVLYDGESTPEIVHASYLTWQEWAAADAAVSQSAPVAKGKAA